MTTADDAARLVPDFDGARCLLGVSVASKCSACADVCPSQAVRIDDDGLKFIEDACLSCGQCRPACPERAVAFPLSISYRQHGAERVALAACAPAIDAAGPGVVPCLHAIGLRELQEMRANGAKRIIFAQADCESCKRRVKAHGFEEAAGVFVRMLASRLLATPLERVSAQEWLRLRDQSAASEAKLVGRRQLFDFLRPRPKVATDPLGFEIISDDDLAAFAPRIAPDKCTGCDACARICPHGALALDDSGPSPAYVIQARYCTDCRLCVDICADAAIDIVASQPARAQRVELERQRCVRCGAPFHAPPQRAQSSSQCRICESTDKPRLYHVDP